MCLGVHIGINTDADGRARALLQCDRVEYVELGLALHIEAGNAGIQGLAHLRTGLADTRKNNFVDIATGSNHPGQFSA